MVGMAVTGVDFWTHPLPNRPMGFWMAEDGSAHQGIYVTANGAN